MNDKVVIYPKTVAQRELEERMGKSIEEIRKEVVEMPNDERFRLVRLTPDEFKEILREGNIDVDNVIID